MKFKIDDLIKCAITKDMLMNYMTNCYNEFLGDEFDEDKKSKILNCILSE